MTPGGFFELVTSLLELVAIVLLVAGAGVVTGAAVGGLVGVGCGLAAAGAMAGGASLVLQLVHVAPAAGGDRG